jgi:uncharacterized protein involved in exopolysaccharide biosynthesis
MQRSEIVLRHRDLARPSHSLAARDLIEIGYRRRGTFATCFVVLFFGAILAAIVLPRRYESEIKILVHRERADALVTAQPTAAMEQNFPSLTEEDINSEVAILRSEDLLENVVRGCGLQNIKQDSLFSRLRLAIFPPQDEDEQTKVTRAAMKLGSDLRIEPVKKSYVIAVSYSSTDPKFAARVLNTLGNMYLQKHAEVHSPNNAFAFFDRETDRYRSILDDADKRLADFNRTEGVVTDQSEKEATVPKLAEFELGMRQTQAQIPQAEEHVRALEGLLQKTPERITTQLHQADNGGLMQQLRSSLVNLEAQRTDMLNKYAPGDRMVQEVEKEIADVKSSIEAQEKSPLREETTDQNPTYSFLREELAKAKADLAALRALSTSSQKVNQSYQAAVVERDQKQLEQQSLIRDAKTAETNYLLYLNKREEARISSAFDKNRILNVSIAESATVPIVPSNPASFILALGFIFACLMSGGIVLAQEHMDTSLRTADEVERALDVPVLAHLPGGNDPSNLSYR